MYLKRLEMKGFKSFANRTKLVFAPGITGIVGPNGSGKSNVTDGIRWVLGEQSAKSLRGAKMEDVIFAGSSSKKPVGYCEVSITFDNTDRKLLVDFAEVTITRRVNRSGESQFFLNKQPCRLKDIHELFMDTGIGKEAYSMIGQGRIDEILSAKSEGRRAIFEEAAGIVKYKTRKKEAERKLEQTEANLSRIHDRVHELKTQIEPMKEQAEKAKEWKEKREQLKQVEIALYVDKIENIHRTWEETTRKVEEGKEKQLALATEYHAKEAELEQIKLQIQERETALEQIQSEMLAISEQIKKEEGKRNVIHERMRQNQAQQESLSRRRKQLDADEKQLVDNQQETVQQLEQKQKEYDEVKKRLSELQQSVAEQDQSVGEKLNALQEEYQRIEHTRIQLVNQLQFLEQQLEQMEEEQKLTDLKKKQALESIQRLEKEARQMHEELLQMEEQQKRFEQEIQELNQKWHEADREEKKLQQQLQQQVHRVEKLRSQLELLKEMEKNREGYFRGVKALLQEKDRGNEQLSGIYGAVAELIEVPSRYEVAIETALGNAMQHLVVADEQVGRNGIVFLKKNQLGRATFLPLNVLKPRKISESELAKCDQLSIWFNTASKLVKTQPMFQTVVDFLLGLVLVVETIEDANRCAYQLQHRYRIVTLDGDMVHPGGSMSGGSRKKTSVHLLGRNKQIEQLQKDWEEAEVAKKKNQDLLQTTLAEKRRLKDEQEHVMQQRDAWLTKIQELHHQIREREFHLQNQQNEFQLIEEEQGQRLAKKAEVERESKSVVEALQKHQQQSEQLKKEIDHFKSRLEQESALKEQEQQLMTSNQVKMARLEQELFHLNHALQRMDQEKEKIQKQQEEMTQEIEQLKQEQMEHQQQKEQLQESLQELERQKGSIQFRLIKERKERERAIQQRDEYEQEIRQLQRIRKQLETEIHESEVRTNRFDVELNHLLEALAAEYELSFERAKELYAPQEEIAVIEKKVRSLKRQLAQLGDVNIGAIDEYERLSERLSFLESQEADLLEAKQKLYAIIEQLEQAMSKQFYEAFEQIRHEFQLVFSQMFGGGKADLVLTDQKQLLETGIEIVAQPPGKRPQYLSLLSGGERALLLLHYYFPFCVLNQYLFVYWMKSMQRWMR